MKVQAVIPSAGLGVRFKAQKPKSFVLLNGRPLVVCTLAVFDQCKEIDSVILVVHPELKEDFEKAIRQFSLKKVKAVVCGGETRSDSVYNGLKVLDDDTEYVVVHDAARPFVTPEIIRRTLEAAKENQAAVAAVPVKSTIKRVDPVTLSVEETVTRENLWEIQTPQVFEKQLLMQAHERFRRENVTDDAMLVEKTGTRVKVVNGDYRNLKITTQEDLLIAEAFCKETQ